MWAGRKMLRRKKEGGSAEVEKKLPGSVILERGTESIPGGGGTSGVSSESKGDPSKIWSRRRLNVKVKTFDGERQIQTGGVRGVLLSRGGSATLCLEERTCGRPPGVLTSTS